MKGESARGERPHRDRLEACATLALRRQEAKAPVANEHQHPLVFLAERADPREVNPRR